MLMSPVNFFARLITQEEACTYHFDQENEAEWKQRKNINLPATQKIICLLARWGSQSYAVRLLRFLETMKTNNKLRSANVFEICNTVFVRYEILSYSLKHERPISYGK